MIGEQNSWVITHGGGDGRAVTRSETWKHTGDLLPVIVVGIMRAAVGRRPYRIIKRAAFWAALFIIPLTCHVFFFDAANYIRVHEGCGVANDVAFGDVS